MINTVNIKLQQLQRGFFSIGTGNEVILIIGSCRAVPYVNYLNDWNQSSNRFTIKMIDPFSFNWDLQENRTDYIAELIKQESNDELLAMLKTVDIFIHEYYGNAEMYNCEKSAPKNIYQFGLNPKMDITLPNWNDIFILAREIVSFDMPIRKMAIQDYNVNGKLSVQTINEINNVRENNLNKFYSICEKTDFPEFAEIFKDEHKITRYAHTFNHIATPFSMEIFRLMNDKFLKLHGIDWNGIKNGVDLYANNVTELSEYDPEFKWNEKIKPLIESL